MGLLRKRSMSYIFLCYIALLLACNKSSDFIPPPENAYWDDFPAWSNSGQMIAFFSTGVKDELNQRGIYITDTTASYKLFVKEVLFLLHVSPVWLQGDSEIVYSNNGIYKININSNRTLLLNNVDIDITTSFDITHDGQHIFYDIPHDDSICNRLIIHRDLVTGSIDTVTCGYHPSIAPDEKQLVYCHNGLITLYSLENDSAVDLGLKGDYPDWSPSGNLIIFQHYDNQQSELDIYTTDLFGNNHIIMDGGSKPRFSPDGLRIIYVKMSNDMLWHLWKANIDGSDNKQLTF